MHGLLFVVTRSVNGREFRPFTAICMSLAGGMHGLGNQ